jgi:hypothetical protein
VPGSDDEIGLSLQQARDGAIVAKQTLRQLEFRQDAVDLARIVGLVGQL